MKEIAQPTIKTSILFVLAFFLANSTAIAEVTEWQDLGGGRARVVSALDPVSGVVEGILDVELQPGWTTYWRNPGESGIPPTFDFSKSTGIRVNQPSFPVPHSKSVSGIISVGYQESVSFPFVASPLTSPLSGELKLEILIGVCEAICIPAIANFSMDMGQLNKSDPLSSNLISIAKSKVPIERTMEGIVDETLPYILDVKKHSETAVRVHAMVPVSATRPELFAEGKRTWFFNPAKLISREGVDAVFELSLVDLPENADLSATPLRLTLTADNIGSERSVLVDRQN